MAAPDTELPIMRKGSSLAFCVDEKFNGHSLLLGPAWIINRTLTNVLILTPVIARRVLPLTKQSQAHFRVNPLVGQEIASPHLPDLLMQITGGARERRLAMTDRIVLQCKYFSSLSLYQYQVVEMAQFHLEWRTSTDYIFADTNRRKTILHA
jgi:hypothetical protein